MVLGEVPACRGDAMVPAMKLYDGVCCRGKKETSAQAAHSAHPGCNKGGRGIWIWSKYSCEKEEGMPGWASSKGSHRLITH